MRPGLKIVTFESEQSDEEEFSRLLSRLEASQIKVSLPSEVVEQIANLGISIDVAVVPSRLRGGANAISTCLQLKAIPELSNIPILALSNSKEKAIVEAIYGAGADIVLVPPFDPNLLSFQVEALQRLKRTFDEELSRVKETKGLTHSSIAALNSTRDGLIITNPESEAIFVNRAASILLGLDQLKEGQDASSTLDQFASMIAQFREKSRANTVSHSDPPRAYVEMSVTRLDGREFTAAVRLIELRATNSTAWGYAVSFSDLGDLKHLANSMLQSERTRTICLILAAGCKNLSGIEPLGTPTAPFSNLLSRLESEAVSSELNSVVTTLLEIIDPVVGPETSIEVGLPRRVDLNMRPSDLLQLVGQVILHAIEFAGNGGEARISVEIPEESPNKCIFLVSADSKRVTPVVAHDLLSDLLAGDYKRFLPEDGASGKASYGLRAAQAIADKYRIDIEVKQVSETRLKIRAKLPLDRSADGAGTKSLEKHPPNNEPDQDQ